MKTVLNIILLLIILGTSSLLSAQCGPTKVETTPETLGYCEGSIDTVAFSVTGQCNSTYEYQVSSSSGNVVQAWANSNLFIINTPVSDTYTVEARCAACPTVVVSDTFVVASVIEPTITGDTLVCHG